MWVYHIIIPVIILVPAYIIADRMWGLTVAAFNAVADWLGRRFY